jgi:hypothetical protein
LEKFRKSLRPATKRQQSTWAFVLSTVLAVAASLVLWSVFSALHVPLVMGEWLGFAAVAVAVATFLFIYLNDAIEVESPSIRPRAAMELRVPEDLNGLAVGDFLENRLRHEDEARHI